MAYFRGVVEGNRGAASRLGSRDSGLSVEAASWQGKVVVVLRELNGVDYACASLERHCSRGTDKLVLYDGSVGGPGNINTWLLSALASYVSADDVALSKRERLLIVADRIRDDVS